MSSDGTSLLWCSTALEAHRRSEAHHGVENDVPPVDDIHAVVAAVGEADVPAAAERAVVAVVPRQAEVKDWQQLDLVAGLATLLEHRHHMVPEPIFAHCDRVAVLALGHALRHLHTHTQNPITA